MANESTKGQLTRPEPTRSFRAYVVVAAITLVNTVDPYAPDSRMGQCRHEAGREGNQGGKLHAETIER